MEVTYLGQNCIRLRGREVQLVIDPPQQSLPGLAKTNPDLIVRTSGATDTTTLRPREGHAQELAGPGEYEVRGVAVRGFPTEAGTIMRVEVDDVRVVSLGQLGRQLTEEEIDGLGHIDVLVVPVGGDVALDPKTASQLTRAVEPAIVIPVNGSRNGAGGDGPVEKFAKEMGMADGWVAVPKLNLNGSMPAPEETRVVILEPRSL